MVSAHVYANIEPSCSQSTLKPRWAAISTSDIICMDTCYLQPHLISSIRILYQIKYPSYENEECSESRLIRQVTYPSAPLPDKLKFLDIKFRAGMPSAVCSQILRYPKSTMYIREESFSRLYPESCDPPLNAMKYK